MAYVDRFSSLDILIAHLDGVVPHLGDPFLRNHYVGFLCVSIVTVFELCLKDIFIGFAEKKHRSFGSYCGNVFERMNGRVSLGDIRGLHVKKFGDKYVDKLDALLNKAEKDALTSESISIKSCYGNVIVWRNSFAHEGVLPANASYDETRKGYAAGKQIIDCLAKAMTR